MIGVRFLTRVRLRNYKNIARCDVELHPLTFVVGPNGAGKSNFLDALRLVADALRTTLEHAMRERGGIAEVRRRSHGHPTDFAIRVHFELSPGHGGHYSFRVGPRERLGFEVKEEQCVVVGPAALERAYFHVRDGTVVDASVATPPAASRDRLYLVSASGLAEFRGVYDGLIRMGFYSLSPNAMRDLQSPDPGDLLARDGSNLASVIERLQAQSPTGLERIEQVLAAIVPGMRGVEARNVGPKQTVEFRQEVAGSASAWKFPAASMSDGTLRVLGILVALFQGQNGDAGTGASLVCVEEPEVALHPAAAKALVESLREASLSRQVMVTSHSPDLLDEAEIEAEPVLAVESQAGEAKIARLAPGEREVLRERLYTLGELLRQGHLLPDAAAVPRTDAQMPLFDQVSTG